MPPLKLNVLIIYLYGINIHLNIVKNTETIILIDHSERKISYIYIIC